MWSAGWWSTFTTSSAFAGLAALLAAGVAWVGVRNRIKADRVIEANKVKAAEDAALKARSRLRIEDARASRWWEMYQWTLARIDVLEPDRVQILLAALEAQAPGDPERA
jgi:hypothetical protein